MVKFQSHELAINSIEYIQALSLADLYYSRLRVNDAKKIGILT